MSGKLKIALGFAAGFCSHIIFQGALGAGFYTAGLIPMLPWSIEPIGPLGVPKSLSLGFWAGLWGIGYAYVAHRLTGRFGRGPGGLVFAVGPLLVHWFVAQPLRGLGAGSGFQLSVVPIEISFHAVFGVGLALTFALLLNIYRGLTRLGSDEGRLG